MHPVAGRLEHAHGGARVIRLEPGVEGVGEQHDVAAVARAARLRIGAGRYGLRRQRGSERRALKPEQRARRQRARPRHAVAQVGSGREARRPGA